MYANIDMRCLVCEKRVQFTTDLFGGCGTCGRIIFETTTNERFYGRNFSCFSCHACAKEIDRDRLSLADGLSPRT